MYKKNKNPICYWGDVGLGEEEEGHEERKKNEGGGEVSHIGFKRSMFFMSFYKSL